MTPEDALRIARALFDSTRASNPRYNSFTGEVRVTDGAAAAAQFEREHGEALPQEQRERASGLYSVVFVSSLPPIDTGSFDVVIRVDKFTREAKEVPFD
ncbi:MAG: hypothetical protein ACAI43_04890 [Phycisphaerae bacterium]|nr:hypothetical protein [Tepidisphaeraceae bacterium]